MSNNSFIVNLAYVLSAGLMIYLGYFVPREETWLLFSGFTLLYISVWIIIKQNDDKWLVARNTGCRQRKKMISIAVAVGVSSF